MAKHKRVLPARRPRERVGQDQSILLQSAETIGRMIGALQRQIDRTRGKLAHVTIADDPVSANGNGSRPPAAKPRKTATRKVTRAAAAKRTGARKPRPSTTAVATKRPATATRTRRVRKPR